MAKIIKDKALGELTLRKYEKPYKLERRELIKKICLSLGLLQPGDSRDVIVDVLMVVLDSKEAMSSDEIVAKTIANREKHGLGTLGTAASNIRRQLKRLRDLYLLEKVGNNYRVTENASLEEIFVEKIEQFYLYTIVARIKEYLREADKT